MASIFARIGQSLRAMFGTDPAVTAPVGANGVQIYAGYVNSGETNPSLVGRQRWTTFQNAQIAPCVAIGLRAFAWRLSGTKWHAVPNKSGSKNSKRAADLMQSGLFDASMPQPWPTRVRKQAMHRWMGSAIHAWKMRQRERDGSWIFAALQHRPMYTIDRWDRPDPQGDIVGVTQLLPTGETYYLPRARLWYSVDDVVGDDPTGVGLLRHVVELVRRLQIIEALELGAYQTDLRGLPIGFAPLSELAKESGADPASAQAKQYVDGKTADIRNILTNSVKDPEKAMWALLDSAPFKGQSPDVISAVLKWRFEMLKGDSSGKAEVDKLVERLYLTVARVCGFEGLLMGGGNTKGTYGAVQSKADSLEENMQSTLTDLADHATVDLARPLTAYNGMDPDEDAPTCMAEPVSKDNITAMAQALQALAAAGGVMPPNWEGWDVLLERARLPPLPEMTSAMAGMLPRNRTSTSAPPDPNDPAAKPDPAKDEVDVDLKDLGDTSGKEAA